MKRSNRGVLAEILPQLFKTLIFLMPLIEIAVFIIVGSIIGVALTLLLVIVSTLVGVLILRAQGWLLLHRTYHRMQVGESPTLDVMNGSLVMLGGFLLVIPGFVTSIIGLLLLVPYIRLAIIRWLVRKHLWQPQDQNSSHTQRVIEGEYKRDDDSKD